MRLKTTILLSPQKMPPDDSKKNSIEFLLLPLFGSLTAKKWGFLSFPKSCGNWQQFPICARCTGELVGILLEAVFFMVWRWYASWGWCVVFAAPLVIDGFLQAKTKWFSNNALRFFTGAFFGIAFVSIFLRIHFLFLEIIKAWLF